MQPAVDIGGFLSLKRINLDNQISIVQAVVNKGIWEIPEGKNPYPSVLTAAVSL